MRAAAGTGLLVVTWKYLRMSIRMHDKCARAKLGRLTEHCFYSVCNTHTHINTLYKSPIIVGVSTSVCVWVCVCGWGSYVMCLVSEWPISHILE